VVAFLMIAIVCSFNDGDVAGEKEIQNLHSTRYCQVLAIDNILDKFYLVEIQNFKNLFVYHLI
jgi:hypothetical protein